MGAARSWPRPMSGMLLQSTGWSLVGPGDPSAWGPPPPMTAKYTAVRQKGPDVAGRPTDLVDVRNRQGNTDELLYLDTATGLVLRREQFENGQPVRVVAFTEVVVGPAARESIPSVNRSQQPQRLRPQALGAPFRAPGRLAAGYRLVGVVAPPGRRPGRLQRWPAQPVGLRAGRRTRRSTAASYRRGGDHGRRPGGPLRVARRPADHLAVGAGDLHRGRGRPGERRAGAVSSFPPARLLSVRQRIRLTSRRLFEELTGRG